MGARPVRRKVKSGNASARVPRKSVPAEAAQVEYRYGSIHILSDGRVRLDARTNPSAPELDFAVSYVTGLADGTYAEDRSNYSIYARMPENSRFFILYLERRRVQSACFNFKLSPPELEKGLALLLSAGGGLERWVKAGLEHTRRSLADVGGSNPATSKAIARILRSPFWTHPVMSRAMKG